MRSPLSIIDALDTLYFIILFFSHFYFPARGQAVVTGVVSSAPRFLLSSFIAHRVQKSHCSSIFHRVLLTHALALSPSQFVQKKKSPRIHTSMHPTRLELTKLTYTTLEDNLIRHLGDRSVYEPFSQFRGSFSMVSFSLFFLLPFFVFPFLFLIFLSLFFSFLCFSN